MPDIPTFLDLGYNIQISVFRACLTAGNVSKDVVDWYAARLEKMAKSEAFYKLYLEPNLIIPVWMGPEEFGKYQADRAAEFEVLLNELGLVGK
jgi:putative tricarboxylic transport membrane protein